jgi:hypothetical protein
MPSLVNWAMLREPYNWLIVILMLLIGVFALHLLAPQDTPISTALAV